VVVSNTGSFGSVQADTVQASTGSFDTVQANTGSFGTVSADTVQADVGQFNERIDVSANGGITIGGGSITGLGAGGGAPNAQAGDVTAMAIGNGAQATEVNSVALGTGAMATATNSVALGAGSVADAPNTVSVGSPGNERRITNVAPGVNGTDAVNVNQLNAAIAEQTWQINRVRREMEAGVAVAIAMGGTMTPSEVGKTTLSANFGAYGGEQAFAFALSHLVTETDWGRLTLNGAVGTGFNGYSKVGGRVGVGLEF
jgi:hypothetical protein